MTTALVLDTHAFLWLLEGNPKLPRTVRDRIEDLTVDLCLPALAVAELVDLISKGRSPLDLTMLRAAWDADDRVSVVPMDEQVATLTGRFESLRDIHDRCMVATTTRLIELGKGAVLVTRDAAVRAAQLVPTVWE
jgi:PIN domain nuclease of toxin-antitoxin system